MKNFNTSSVSKIDIGVLDAKSTFRLTNYQSKRPGGGSRGQIRELSRQSRSRLIFKARNIPGLKTMITFTYPHADYAENASGGDFMTDGSVVKNHLRKLRQLFTYRDIYGFWFLEFQARGAPHFHFCLCQELPPGQLAQIKKTWNRMVGTPCEHHLERGVDYQVLKKKHAAGAYAAKYSGKAEQKTVPDRYQNVGRFWGLFGKIPDDLAVIPVQTKQELYRLIRIAKGYIRSQARANGYKVKTRTGRGLVGSSLYNAAPVLRAYLEYHYTIWENPSRIVLLLHETHTTASGPPSWGDTAKTYGRPFRSLSIPGRPPEAFLP